MPSNEWKTFKLKDGANPRDNAVLREIAALANSGSGTLYFSFKDNKHINTVWDAQKLVHYMIVEYIYPSLENLCYFSPKENEDGETVLAINVYKGPERPYRLSHASGNSVYIKRDGSTVIAKDKDIQAILEDRNHVRFESQASKIENLSFYYAYPFFQNELTDRGFLFMSGLANENSMHTNLALLVSDQNTFKIEASFYKNENSPEPIKQIAFEGSIIKQIADISKLLGISHGKSQFTTILGNIYPSKALLRSLLFCIVHRDYSEQQSACSIRILPYFISFAATGMPSWSAEGSANYKKYRNPKLAGLLEAAGLLEPGAGGVNKIISAYKNTGKEPYFTDMHYTMGISLPSVSKELIDKSFMFLTFDEERVIHLAKDTDFFRTKDIIDKLELNYAQARSIIKALMDKEIVFRRGKGKSTVYCLSKYKDKL